MNAGDGAIVMPSLLAVVAASLVATGFTRPLLSTAALMAAGWALGAVLMDAAFFGGGIRLAPYCGEPECDPGPIPAVFSVVMIPVGVMLVAAGIGIGRIKRRQRAAPTRA